MNMKHSKAITIYARDCINRWEHADGPNYLTTKVILTYKSFNGSFETEDNKFLKHKVFSEIFGVEDKSMLIFVVDALICAFKVEGAFDILMSMYSGYNKVVKY